MKALLILSVLSSLLKGGFLICFGLLIRNYFEPFISMLIRREIPEGLINDRDYYRTMILIQIIGTIIIIVGVIVIIAIIITWIKSQNMMSSANFKFDF